jgi:hypothetical protein
MENISFTVRRYAWIYECLGLFHRFTRLNRESSKPKIGALRKAVGMFSL